MHANRLPSHVAIIPDGNRRWAAQRGLKKEEGYEHGLAAGLLLYEQCLALGIPQMTWYGFTNDNTKRPSPQKQAFRRACVDAVAMMQDRDAAILVVGNDDSAEFPEELRRYRTRQPSGRNLMAVNFLVNYDWRWDLEVAQRQAASHGSCGNLMDAIGSAAIPRIDLVVRWGGCRRLSGMLPIQTVYADFYVVDPLWPDIRAEHFEAALAWYARQDRTLGG